MRVYNTLTNRKEDFVPVNGKNVNMYVCGPTVYDYMHIGNARTFVVFDAVYRYLSFKGYTTRLALNFTDIDDRIIERSALEGTAWDLYANRYIAETKQDFKNLNMREADFNPRVSECMPDIIIMIETLIAKRFAYAKEGAVFFDTTAFSGYGKLSGKNIDELIAGARIEINTSKDNLSDFVLWKPAKDGEPSWDAPWGRGRPGWHIECSVMAKKYLADTIDIHAGGEDLIFPHHENEIAQSEAANGVPFAKYWMHARHLNINNQKMSKSTGNFFTLREIAREYPYPVIRFFLLSSHYRSPMSFSEELLKAAQNGYNRIANCVAVLEASPRAECSPGFIAAMDDDFNTADAISAVFELVTDANKNPDADKIGSILTMLDILGNEMPGQVEITDGEIEILIKQRNEARKNKDFKSSDEIRQKLFEMGIILEDTRDGTRYKLSPPLCHSAPS